MNAIIAKTLDTLISQAKKIPQFLLVVLVFVTLFSKQAKYIFSIFNATFFSLLSESIVELLNKLLLTKEQFIYTWSFFLITMLITFIWNILSQSIEESNSGSLKLGGDILLYINSIIFIFFLIYNKLSTTPLVFNSEELSTVSNSLYFCVLGISFAVFFLLFSLIYLKIFWDIGPFIWKFKLKIGYRIACIFIYLIVLQKIANTILLP